MISIMADDVRVKLEPIGCIIGVPIVRKYLVSPSCVCDDDPERCRGERC